MMWILAALGAPALWAASNIIDEELLRHRLRDPLSLMAMTGTVAGIPGLVLLLWSHASLPDVTSIAIAIVVGVLALGSYLPYYYALLEDDAADVIMFWNLAPVLIAVLAAVFADERLSFPQYAAMALLVVGSLIAQGGKRTKPVQSGKAYLLMLFASVVVAVEVTLGKILYERTAFASGFMVVSLAMLAVGLVALCVRFSYLRKRIRRHEAVSLGVNELLDTSATTLKSFALSIGPASLVQALEGVQPLFIVLLEMLGVDGIIVKRSRAEYVRLAASALCVVLGLGLLAAL